MKCSLQIVFLAMMLINMTFSQVFAKVELVQGNNQIDVMIDGELFTSYVYNPELTKPILYPVNTPAGILLNRNFPYKTVEGESKDHPHHTGIFFTYDEVNQDGFWGNTKYPPQIKHVEVTEMKSGRKQATLSVVLHWIGKSGKTLLEEKRTMVFFAGKKENSIDFSMTLTAKDTAVVFGDTKEGMFGIRVADWLKEGKGTGKYLNSEGAETEKNVWGRRAKWVVLTGEKEGNKVGLAIMNHPKSVNFPTFWHARGYGLFAVNPLGQAEFQHSTGVANPQPLNLTLQQGQSALFKFRVTVFDGVKSKEQLDKEFDAYTN